MRKLESNFDIGEEVQVNYGKNSPTPPFTGTVVKIIFTKSKVLYCVIADSNAVVYHEIDITNVYKTK